MICHEFQSAQLIAEGIKIAIALALVFANLFPHLL